MNTPASVTSTLQRLFWRPSSLTVRFRSSTYPDPDPAPVAPVVPHVDFMDTRPVIFRSEAFDEELLPTRGNA